MGHAVASEQNYRQQLTDLLKLQRAEDKARELLAAAKDVVKVRSEAVEEATAARLAYSRELPLFDKA